MGDVSLVCPTKLEDSGCCAGSDHDRAATKESSSGKKPNRILCGNGVNTTVGNGDHGFGVRHPRVVLELEAGTHGAYKTTISKLARALKVKPQDLMEN